VFVAEAKLPTPACVKRTSRAFHPIGQKVALVRVPQGDLKKPSFAPTLSLTARGISAPSMSRSPLLLPKLPSWDRIWRLLFAKKAKDYFQKPPSNVASWSPSTTLYGTLA